MVPNVSKEHTASTHTAVGSSETTVTLSDRELQFQQQIRVYICYVEIYAAGCLTARYSSIWHRCDPFSKSFFKINHD